MPINTNITNTLNPQLQLDAGLALMKQSGQDNSLKVVVENPRLSAMPVSVPAVDAVAPIAGPTMAADIKLTGVRTPIVNGAILQQAFTPPVAAVPVVDALPKTEMQAHQDAMTANIKQGYLRLRVRVAKNQISIVSVNAVDGPLAQPNTLIGQHAYEVVLDSQQIAVEGLPDIGESRSYPRPGQNEHNITQRNVFEFNIRIPQSAVPADALARLTVNLYRFPDALPKPLAGKALLSSQYGAQAKLVANFDGIKADRIEPIAVDQLKAIFPAFKLQ